MRPRLGGSRRPTPTRRRRTTGSSFRHRVRMAAELPAVALLGAQPTFEKQSTPPALICTRGEARASHSSRRCAGRPTLGAKDYHLQVATESTFASPIDDVTTASTEYTALKTYAAAKTLYWRIQATRRERNTGLTWSRLGHSRSSLPSQRSILRRRRLATRAFRCFAGSPFTAQSPTALRIHEPNDNTPSTYSGYPVHGGFVLEDHRHGNLHVGDTGGLPERTAGTTPGPVVRSRRITRTRSRSRPTRCRARARTGS